MLISLLLDQLRDLGTELHKLSLRDQSHMQDHEGKFNNTDDKHTHAHAQAGRSTRTGTSTCLNIRSSSFSAITTRSPHKLKGDGSQEAGEEIRRDSGERSDGGYEMWSLKILRENTLTRINENRATSTSTTVAISAVSGNQ